VSGRRVVRVSADFFDQLDSQLGAERGPAGEPSATDFVVVDLPTVVERFALHFDDLPEAVEGVPDLRVVVGTGEVVRAFVVYGLLLTDGAVELIGVDIDNP
jgi:hypothetical protein